ncbi:ABC transporter ATP-binding protein [Dinghuibacter silviterrae]|uniref:ATP-binding cassette subfamily B protein n=1 Tax=Dinghuibacter silviterrae TaxID=1539049 RepID=A0A4R8DVT2_9BACT|nr:ABC transporter ATP-binding protein [Dinghuibacter silviterrae]TDX01321.1 ATP-binding cassette subfamily B protein [Dinghuibacter silviterrae]
MQYNLNKQPASPRKNATWGPVGKLLTLMTHERPRLIAAFVMMMVNSGLNLLGPLLSAHVIDKYIISQHPDFNSVLRYGIIFLAMYFTALFTGYAQTRLMAGFGQRLLFTLRNSIFGKLQELPVAFFNQNKAGDLISRVNNDTDKINQFFSQSLMQFLSSIFIMTGAAIFMICLNWRLGLATLAPGAFLYLFTKVTSAWVKTQNARSMKSTGGLSAEIQESLQNFKVIIAFNRRDYFREKFQEANAENYENAVRAGIANNIYTPVYGMCAGLGQLVVLLYGIHMIQTGVFQIGQLVAFLAYATYFYNPLRQLAALWAAFQVALAGWDRISAILHLENNLLVEPASGKNHAPTALMSFRNVYFHYPDGKEVLHDINFDLERGKTYAFIGPTGGGKTTTASLVARLYDPTRGSVWLDGRDIKTYDAADRTGKIGFILQEPILFSGTVRENILYGNPAYSMLSPEQLQEALREEGLSDLLDRFDTGLDTPVSTGGETMSLGQRQLIAFMRAVLRHPDLLILDEATANIDTVTEQLLEGILRKLPETTTRVIIAHRLNTIESADEIFFVNSGEVTRAGSFGDAVEMLMSGKRVS